MGRWWRRLTVAALVASAFVTVTPVAHAVPICESESIPIGQNTEVTVDVCVDPDEREFSLDVSVIVEGRQVRAQVYRWTNEQGEKETVVCVLRLPSEIPPNLIDPSALCKRV